MKGDDSSPCQLCGMGNFPWADHLVWVRKHGRVCSVQCGRELKERMRQGRLFR